MADHRTRNAIHVELPSVNPFASEEHSRRGAWDDDEEFPHGSDDEIVELPDINPFAAGGHRNRPRDKPGHRGTRQGGERHRPVRASLEDDDEPGRRRPDPRFDSPPRRVRPTLVDEDQDEKPHATVLPSDNPFGLPSSRRSPRRSPERNEEGGSEEDSDIEPPRVVGRRSRVDIPVESGEKEIIKDWAPRSPPKRRDSSPSEEEDERVVISSTVGAQVSDEPTSDGERPTVQLPSENPFGRPAGRGRARSPMPDKDHWEKQGYSHVDDQGVIYVQLPNFNPFGTEPENRRPRSSSIEDTSPSPIDLPTRNPLGPRHAGSENPFARAESTDK